MRHGIPAITFGAGCRHDVHTVEEYVDLKEYLDGCTYALGVLAIADLTVTNRKY